ncbi:hypothetical protein niasHT_034523 [Heterodera trifolii]|uniref:Uncharacterized protein n=1 Tax=Heterodera trifolii TaxID=157864 RepID=A0ABD2J6W2_9BILA
MVERGGPRKRGGPRRPDGGTAARGPRYLTLNITPPPTASVGRLVNAPAQTTISGSIPRGETPAHSTPTAQNLEQPPSNTPKSRPHTVPRTNHNPEPTFPDASPTPVPAHHPPETQTQRTPLGTGPPAHPLCAQRRKSIDNQSRHP